MSNGQSMKHLRTKYLAEQGYVFEAKNNGEHLVVLLAGGKVDYWPSSGKFHDHTTGHRGDNSDEFHSLIKARRNCEPVVVRGVNRPVENTIDPRDDKIKELEDLLFQAFTLRTNWDVELTAKVNKALSKATAHNGLTKLPWD